EPPTGCAIIRLAALCCRLHSERQTDCLLRAALSRAPPTFPVRRAMKLPRLKFLHLAAGAAALPAVSRVAEPQSCPTRPARIIIGSPAGTTADIIARLLGQWLSERLGQPFLIEDRPGAASTIATEVVVRAPADGHTLLCITPANPINTAVYDKLNYDFLRD